MDSTVYLLHLEPGLPVTANRVARHPIGPTSGNLDARVALHQRRGGSPLIAAAVAARAQVSLQRTWRSVRHVERARKRRHQAPRLCSSCVAAGATGGRGPLLTGQPR